MPVKAEFVVSAAQPVRFPADGLPEIAFLGRSNVGKSSLINTLLGQKGLAFTSGKPGCTQTLNFYRVGGEMYFVDLPGYGYARTSRQQTREWKKLIDSYLLERRTLRLCVLVLDARRGWMEMDLGLKEWLESQGRPYSVVATKTDKWKNQSERSAGMAALRRDAIQPVLFSAETGRGVKEVWQQIAAVRGGRRDGTQVPPGAPLPIPPQ
jgi:GTP-binding protein